MTFQLSPKDHAQAARRTQGGWLKVLTLLALLAAPLVQAQTPNLALQNCNKVWGTSLSGTTGLAFFNVSDLPTSGPTLATAAAGTRGAALAIDDRSGYLYVIQDDSYITRYNGSSGVGVQVFDMNGPAANTPSGNLYARATIVNGILLVMTSSPVNSVSHPTTTNSSSYTVLRYSIDAASGAFTELPPATVTIPYGPAVLGSGEQLQGGDLAQDDTTDRLFLLVNRSGGGVTISSYFLELPRTLYSNTGAGMTVNGTPLNNGAPRTGLAASNYGGFAIHRGEFYVAAANGNYAKIPTDMADNPPTVTMQAPSATSGNAANTVDLASCGIPVLSITKNAQAFLADGTTTSPFAVEGGFVEYTVAVQNTGSTNAEGSTMTDTLPAGTSYVANSTTINGAPVAGTGNPFDPSEPINSPGRAAGSIGYAASSNTATIVYRIRVDTLTNALTNQASAAFSSPIPSATPDCGASPQVNCATRTIPASARLMLSKSISAPGRVNAADQFSVRIRNGSTDVVTAATTGTGTTAATATTFVALGITYTLDEIMAASSIGTLGNYATSIACTNTEGNAATTLPAGSGQSFGITPQAGDNIACTLTNIRRPGLTLVKTLTNDNGGSATLASFTLSATGAGGGTSDISGTSGSTAVTNAVVGAGTYTLAETNLPNYIASPWTCSDGVVVNANSQITLVDGATTTCTINNNDSNQADLSITKSNPPGTLTAGTQTTYTIVVNNAGPAAAGGAILRDVPVSGLSACSVTNCASSGGAQCPSIPANLLASAGTAVPAFPAGGAVTFTLVCTVN